MRIKNVKGVIWDLDGTLLDSFKVFAEVIADVVETTGHAMPSQEQMLSNYHGSLEETVQRVLGIESDEEVGTTVRLFLQKQERHYANDLETHLFKDAVTVAQAAAQLGIHQMIVTNRAHKDRGYASPKTIVAATTLADCIHEISTSDECAYRKPDGRSTGDWMQRQNITPEQLVVIGDQHVDAQLALNLGARAVIIKRNGEIPHIDESIRTSNDILFVDSLDGLKVIPPLTDARNV